MSTPGAVSRSGLKFTRAQRLTRASEIELVKRAGKRIRTGHLDVRAITSPLAHSRIGVVVPKYRRTVIERNLLRRRLRELARTRLIPVLTSTDVLIRPLPHAYGISFDALAAEMEQVRQRLIVVASAQQSALGGSE